MFEALASRYRNWRQARNEERIEKLTARAADLSENEEHDLLTLQKRGLVRAHAIGQSITQVHGQIENLIRKSLRVSIKPGTYFVATGHHQNMVTRTEHRVTLPPCATQNVAINATCINADLPVPRGDARFRGVKRVPKDVARFLEASQRADPMAVQAGVWALTNHYSRDKVQSTLLVRDRYGNTHRAVSDAHISEAKRILDELGIRNRL
jgi:hypothetical protein